MNRFAFGAALAALTVALPGVAQAQRNNASPILVVDTDRVFAECTACRAAQTQLQTQVQQVQQLAQQLAAPLQTEGQQIETAVRALNGRQPDAALQTRITNFQNRQNQASQQVQQRQNTIRSTEAHVNQQIGQRLIPITESIRNARGALVVLNKGSTFANAPATDVTNEVLQQLNQQLPSVSVTPMPQQAPAPGTQPQPQGR
ncbi:MAG TPA: OmpH family outer membrane protein [Solirubrobacterales bacterium]|jgi:Skp family chaperone for outer membrane proteins